MRLLFVTDARSPISQNWMRFFANRGDEIYIATTFQSADMDFPVKRMEFTPVAFSSAKKQSSRPGSASSRTLGLRTLIRQWFGPLTIPRSAKKLRTFIQEVQPDIIHAMRVPFEGMLTAKALRDIGRGNPAPTPPKFVVSIWGNDFTLHAPSAPLMGYYTRLTMSKADALHADVERDVLLAREWGLSEEKATLVVPGNGGIRADVFYPPKEVVTNPVIINPRGIRPYVRNDVFFKSIPLVLEKRSDARFLCTGMQSEAQVMEWMRELKIEHAVELLPLIPHAEMGEVFRGAQIVVSPAIHDGTPNSLIEGMACGCFPVAGDLESIREWITHGQNGLLVNPNDPQSIADALLLGLEREDLRRDAAGLNANIISTRAEYGVNMGKVVKWYEVVSRKVDR
jgi:glycosyltransferase involved in cell wall biosynthesis